MKNEDSVSCTALLAGATGLIGRHVLAGLLDSPRWTTVRVLTRRAVAHENAKLDVHRLDFDELGGIASNDPALFDVDAVFCCLGTTIKAAGSRDAFRRVDHDYIVALAKAGQAGGASRFLLVSAIGADANSLFFYNRVKGQTEDAIRSLDFDALHIFQPSLLLGDRDENRPGEAAAQKLMPAFSPLLGGGLARYRPVHAKTVAAAMIRAAESSASGQFVHRFNGKDFD